mmetsp:Transcript_145921/g.363851  ORF Transcript_145921/g.363851 Transcript_145921/m.363851 type:complete len:236 (+) Transcript_145921:114-821(+)
MMVPDAEYCPGPLPSGSPVASSQGLKATPVGTTAAADVKSGAAGRSARWAADQRALLFGSRLGPSGIAKGRDRVAAQHAADLHAAHSRVIVEEQNDALVGDLAIKVSALKQVSEEVGKEASESARLVEDMNSPFDKARSLLSRTHEHLRGVAKQAGGRHMMCLIAFFVSLLVLLFVLNRFIGGGNAAASATPIFLAPTNSVETASALSASSEASFGGDGVAAVAATAAGAIVPRT